MSTEDFKLILIVARNPLHLEFSHFNHLKKKEVKDRLLKNKGESKRIDFAKSDFESFVCSPVTHFYGDLKDFFTIEGTIPKNLKIISFENIKKEIPKLVRPFQKYNIPFPHRNKTSYSSQIPDISIKAWQNLYKKYQWIYDNTHYEYPLDIEKPEIIAKDTLDEKKLIVCGGLLHSGSKEITCILGEHNKIFMGFERFNNLCSKNNFRLSVEHFRKERFFTMNEGDTYYNNIFRYAVQSTTSNIMKYNDTSYLGLKYDNFDNVIEEFQNTFKDIIFIYIYKNIWDIASAWKKDKSIQKKWPGPEYLFHLVQQYNQSFHKINDAIRKGRNIICLNCDSIFLSNEKDMKPLFIKLEINNSLKVKHKLIETKKETSSKKNTKDILTDEEVSYISNHAKWELFELFNNNYNIMK